MGRIQSYLHDWSCLPHQLVAASLLLYLKYFPNHHIRWLKLLQGQWIRQHDSINSAWLSAGLDMRRSAWGRFFCFFFNATVVIKDSQCSERITVPGGFNINNANPHALHTSWSSHPKEFSYRVNRNKHSFSRVHLQWHPRWRKPTLEADVLLFRLASLDSIPYWQCWNGKIPARASFLTWELHHV